MHFCALLTLLCPEVHEVHIVHKSTQECTMLIYLPALCGAGRRTMSWRTNWCRTGCCHFQTGHGDRNLKPLEAAATSLAVACGKGSGAHQNIIFCKRKKQCSCQWLFNLCTWVHLCVPSAQKCTRNEMDLFLKMFSIWCTWTCTYEGNSDTNCVLLCAVNVSIVDFFRFHLCTFVHRWKINQKKSAQNVVLVLQSVH
jgi:hypothetical protein